MFLPTFDFTDLNTIILIGKRLCQEQAIVFGLALRLHFLLFLTFEDEIMLPFWVLVKVMVDGRI